MTDSQSAERGVYALHVNENPAGFRLKLADPEVCPHRRYLRFSGGTVPLGLAAASAGSQQEVTSQS